MKKIINKSLSILFVTFLLVGCSNNTSTNSIATMQDQSISADEMYNANKASGKADFIFNEVDTRILEEKYGYETNEEVKNQVDEQIKTFKEQDKQQGSDTLKTFNAEDYLGAVKNSGYYVSIQRGVYTKDYYTANFVTDETLKKLYDSREGETVSYSMIKLDLVSFDYDSTKMDAAKTAIETKLAASTADTIKNDFDTLAKEYKASDQSGFTNGDQGEKPRSSIDEITLKELDNLKYLEFNKTAITGANGEYIFVFKTDADQRLSFEASKEKLTDLQYTNAKSENSYLDQMLLAENRKKHAVKLTDPNDQKMYDAKNQFVIDEYNTAKEEANK